MHSVPATAAPSLVTVVVRSYRRLAHVLELAPRVLAQDYPRLELLIVEQSGADARALHAEALQSLCVDPRVTLLQLDRLGPARARNVGWESAGGELLVFLDDDDLPIGRDWLSKLVRGFSDPCCVAVSGRHVYEGEESSDQPASFWERRRCLRYSWLKMPRGYTRHGTRITGVTQVAGTNSAIRISAIRRVGGWDVIDDHDEDSFALKFAHVRKRGEYFMYEPDAQILRRLDLPGGVDRRYAAASRLLRSELEYSHLVVARYYGFRFFLLYPLYVALALRRASHDARRFHNAPGQDHPLLELARSITPELIGVWRKLAARARSRQESTQRKSQEDAHVGGVEDDEERAQQKRT